MKNIYFVFLFTAILFSCKNENASQKDLAAKSQSETQTNQSVSDAEVVKYPRLPDAIARSLVAECDFIDYIFYKLPISISQGDKSAIHSNLSFISNDVPASIPDQCKAIGRKSFQKDGEIMLEADVYINESENCFFYVFYENGKKTYANNMTTEGINFYRNVFGQAGIK